MPIYSRVCKMIDTIQVFRGAKGTQVFWKPTLAKRLHVLCYWFCTTLWIRYACKPRRIYMGTMAGSLMAMTAYWILVPTVEGCRSLLYSDRETVCRCVWSSGGHGCHWYLNEHHMSCVRMGAELGNQPKNGRSPDAYPSWVGHVFETKECFVQVWCNVQLWKFQTILKYVNW